MNLNSEQIWTNYHKDIKHYILSEVRDKDMAHDILQDVFIKAHSNLHQLKEEQKCKQWLLRIAKNTITDHFRKDKKNIRIVPDIIQVPEDSSANERFVKCMSSFIGKLPEHYKEAVVLADLQNIDQVQLAKRLKISYSGVKSRVQRGRQLLKNMFLKCCHISSDKYGNIIDYKSKPNYTTCGT
ncbi:MAG: hypothetical protein K0S32_3241 [Bacteroidetes bacterium]|jgi:RNA polymerase sigma-70 factor (ECF subfamily)|nr:hypothetical protein [Bacteroidota bacterium]